MLRGKHHHHHSHGDDITPPGNAVNRTTKSTDSTQENNTNANAQQKENEAQDIPRKTEPVVGACLCCSEDPARDLESLQQMAEEVQVQHQDEPSMTNDHSSHDHFVPEENGDEQGDSVNVGNAQGDAENEDKCDEHDEAKLMRMSINTALAIGLHNFPEVCIG